MKQDIQCRDVVKEVQRQLNIQHVLVCYDQRYIVKEKICRGEDIVYLSVIDDTAENEEYRKKTEEMQTIYRTKSPRIHFPDLSVNEIVKIYKSGIEDEYVRMTLLFKEMNILIRNEVAFVCFIFLHEVGHWNQLHQNNRLVKKYTENDTQIREEIYNAQNTIIKRIKKRALILGSNNPNIKESERKKYHELQVRYRKIPNEAEADNYAFSMLPRLNMDLFIQ